ncbi:hypothetical protein ABEB36_011983 [Hypothenemus hampei]|uniref:Uncharacterized protein n=1 Tax=Hypothenemus hampei TaxID=57062 RepID=A0ABD1E9N6_HYPHA
MRSKHETPKKIDYLKASSFNLIETERTNCELENEKNIGKIDGCFYKTFSWQIMGTWKARSLSQSEIDVQKAKKHNDLTEIHHATNGRIYETSSSTRSNKETVVTTHTAFTGSFPKKYVSTCYLKPKIVPNWYTERLLIHLGSTKRSYNEQVWFKFQLKPYYWSENMTTQVNLPKEKQEISEITIPVPDEKNVHYISLEPQQTKVEAN